MSENVVPLPDELDRLVEKIKSDLERCVKSEADWVDATLDLCIDLAKARKEFNTNEGFGQWFDAGGFGLNAHDRSAAISMGQEPERAREVLTATKRRSLQLIYEKEFRLASASKTPAPKQQLALDAYDRLKEAGEQPTRKAVQAAAGVGKATVEDAFLIREVAEPTELPPLPMTSQQKLDAHQRKLEREFDARVEHAARLKSQEWLDEVRLPIYEKKLDEIERMLKWPRNAVMTKAEYNAIVRCLHPDSLQSRTEEQLAEAFRIFTKYKPKMVGDEETRKAVLSTLPRTREEMLARKRSKA